MCTAQETISSRSSSPWPRAFGRRGAAERVLGVLSMGRSFQSWTLALRSTMRIRSSMQGQPSTKGRVMPLTLLEAHELINGAHQRARDLGTHITVAIVDE